MTKRPRRGSNIHMSQCRFLNVRRALSRGLRPGRPSSGDGQALAEFALIFPLLVVLVMATIEFALAFQASLGINRASQDAVLIASEASDSPGSDCLILQKVEADIQTPNDRRRILEVQVQRTGPAGGRVYAADIYSRSGSTTCTVAGGSTVTVPYTATSVGYPDAQRCNILAGCPTYTPPRTTIDNIAVQVKYTYTWTTPLGSLISLIGGSTTTGTGWTFQKRNVARLEPVL